MGILIAREHKMKERRIGPKVKCSNKMRGDSPYISKSIKKYYYTHYVHKYWYILSWQTLYYMF
jgi:hypothetical protein